MRDLPSGTVTFLFTDIEGSTKLLHEVGAERYTKVLADHRAVVREACSRHDGIEVDTQGDAFFVVFPTAPGALAAAREAQETLEIPVRMGLHTGTPILTDEGYVGADVHRAARIAAAGHGRQVLVSAATAALLQADGLRDLGEHRLKDLSAPERIWQLGDGEFPRLKTLYQTNLPVQTSRLVGRERELAEVIGLVESHRLVTLVGAGGSGKTRLALQAAAEVVDEFPDGVWFVSLAALTDSELLVPTIAQVVGPGDDLDVHLRGKELLLLLDNLEQLLPEVAETVAALDARVLVTSREPLRVTAEQEYEVPTLPRDEAFLLFTERARQIRTSFEPDEHVTEIVQLLDGLPLAVELAAARTKLLRPKQIVERLPQALELLSGGARDAPERQRTLRATIDWSYELLTDDEKRLFRRLAVFAGSFDLEAAEAVCESDLDTLGSLVDKSLLRQTTEGRFFLLATIREYAAERLAKDPGFEGLRRRHAERTLLVAEAAAARRHEGIDELQALHDDGRAALELFADSGDTELVLRLARAFADFWLVRGHVREGQRRLEAALAAGEDAPPELRLGAMVPLAMIARVAGDPEGAEAHALAALELAREVSDAAAASAALRALGQAALARDDHARTLALYDQALAVARDADDSLVPALIDLADVALTAGEFERAMAYAAEAADLADAPATEAIAGFNTASALVQLERLDQAPPHLRAALETVIAIDYPELIGWCLIAAAGLAAGRDPRDALLLLGSGEAAVHSAGAALGPAERRLREWVLSRLRRRVGAAEVDEGLEAGRSLSIDEGVSLARAYLD